MRNNQPLKAMGKSEILKEIIIIQNIIQTKTNFIKLNWMMKAEASVF